MKKTTTTAEDCEMKNERINTNHHHFQRLNMENAKHFQGQLNLKLKKI